MQTIIPYQEQLGNYNTDEVDGNGDEIIPYQEQLGNYNNHKAQRHALGIIP